MIVFLAVRHHLYTVHSLCTGSFGPALPAVRGLSYEDMLTAGSAPRATYVFTDIERLSAWERLLAADLFRTLQQAGCRCLNDPARVLTRHALLGALHRAGINPFRAWRVEDGVAGPRFPVFLRNEADHGQPLTGLLRSQEGLDEALAALAAAGLPLPGVLAVEFCAAPLAPGAWAKFGTFRIADTISTDHAVIEDNWCVKHGTLDLATPAMFAWESGHVANNSFAAALAPVFDIAGIEYGRADHATVDGREVIYEINTNPYLAPLEPQVSPVRDETVATARARFAAALWRLDGGDGADLRLQPGPRALEHRDRSDAVGTPYRP